MVLICRPLESVTPRVQASPVQLQIIDTSTFFLSHAKRSQVIIPREKHLPLKSGQLGFWPREMEELGRKWGRKGGVCVCVGEWKWRGKTPRGPEGAGVRGGGSGQGRASGSGALEVLVEGQDAERKVSYSRETSLITAGGYSEGILWPAWDARGKKKKSCLFTPRGSGYFRNTRNSMFRFKHQPHVTGR